VVAAAFGTDDELAGGGVAEAAMQILADQNVVRQSVRLRSKRRMARLNANELKRTVVRVDCTVRWGRV